jgi:hypothetical protein
MPFELELKLMSSICWSLLMGRMRMKRHMDFSNTYVEADGGVVLRLQAG